MKSRDGKRQREEQKREDDRRERVRRKNMQIREKVGKSRNTVFLLWFVAPEGLAKAAGAEPSGQMRDEQLHAVVARSTFRSQNVQNTPFSDHFWKLRCRKSARHCGTKHISKSKCWKHQGFGPPLEVQMSIRVAGERDGAPSQKWAKRKGFVAFSTTPTTPHYTPIQYTTVQLQLHLHYIPLHYITLH